MCDSLCPMFRGLRQPTAPPTRQLNGPFLRQLPSRPQVPLYAMQLLNRLQAGNAKHLGARTLCQEGS